MRKFLLNKLVRDSIVPDMQSKGQQVVSRQLTDDEFLLEAARKVQEETAEFDPAKPDIKELADILEAAETTIKAAKDIAAKTGISPEELEAMQLKRHNERGGFVKRTYVESVTLADDDPWVTYYASNPTRFLETKD